MGLRGCVDIDCLSLQILLRENPAWVGTPVAVTRDERPQSPILALSREAREKGLAVGIRYANALSLVPGLKARAVPADRIAAARDHIVQSLFAFTPDIELCPFDADALWASVDGLRSLFTTEARWSGKVQAALAAEGFRAIVVVGFTRFGTYAIARSRLRSMVFTSREEESALMARSPIDMLPLPERTKSTLRKLEIRTVQQYVSLPEGETIQRFGKEAGILRRAILSDDPLPIQPLAEKKTVPCARHLDAPLADLGLLMPHIEELLALEAQRAESAKSVIAGLTVILRTEDGDVTTDLIRPAVPTLKTSLLLRLIQLRLSARQFRSGVEDVTIRSARTQPSRTQEELFTARGRDMQAGARAFAAIRARFGNESVSCAQLRDSYLPERSFTWVPMRRPVLPAARRADGPESEDGACPVVCPSQGRPTAVRRIFFTPRQAQRNTGSLNTTGDPFVVSGSWWGTGSGDAPFLRNYFFDHSEGGVLWLYVDRLTHASWVQGTVD